MKSGKELKGSMLQATTRTWIIRLPAMTDFKKHIDDLMSAEVATQKKTPASYTYRDQCLSIVILDLNQLANYVDEVSGGNLLIIQKAGMDSQRSAQKLTELDTPYLLQVESKSTGKIAIKCSKVDRANGYIFEYNDNLATGTWHVGNLSSTTKTTITGLTSVKEYWVRVYATGTNDVKSDYSDPIAVVVK